MRIAIWWEQNDWGGVDTHLLSLLTSWPRAQDSFIIFSNKNNQGLTRIRAKLEDLENVTISDRQFTATHSGDQRFKVLRYFLLLFRFSYWVVRFKKLLKREGPFDVVICENGAYPGGWSCLATIVSARVQKISQRILVVHHAADAPSIFRVTTERLLDRLVQNSATEIVAVSRATRSTLIERRHFNTVLRPIRVIHNGILGADINLNAGVDLRTQLKIPSDSVVIGILGRIERYKGHEDMLVGMSMFNSQRKETIHLVIVGSGDDEEIHRLKRMAESLNLEERIHFVGYIDTEVAHILRNFDILASCTKDFEAFGLTIAEAMATGTSILVTSVGGVTELVSPDCGLIVHPEAPHEIAEAIAFFCDHQEQIQEYRKNAVVRVRQFSSERMVDRFLYLLGVST